MSATASARTALLNRCATTYIATLTQIPSYLLLNYLLGRLEIRTPLRPLPPVDLIKSS